jgi:hypothetical protein
VVEHFLNARDKAFIREVGDKEMGLIIRKEKRQTGPP